MTNKNSYVVKTARTYYNSDDADNFYAIVWGGEDIHIGIYNTEKDSIFEASRRTVHKIANLLSLNATTKVLDIGSGYGGTARYLTRISSCQVDCLNLSEVQNRRNRKLNQEHGLDDKINIIEGSFENIPLEKQRYDIVVSQDAILHSANRHKVLKEVHRVLKPNGKFIFTDPMQSDACPPGVLQPVLDRIHLDSMGSFAFYVQVAEEIGFEKIQLIDMAEQLINHYTHVAKEIDVKREKLLKVCSAVYIEKMKVGLNHWITNGNKGYLTWGILHFRKL